MLFTRESAKRYKIGFDIGEYASQVSWISPGMQGSDPVTFRVRPDDDIDPFSIPTALVKKTGANLWYCGEEAKRVQSRGGGTLVNHIFSSAVKGNPVRIEDQDYDPCSLLALFVRRVLALMQDSIPADEISCIMFTSEVMDTATVNALNKMKEFLSLPVENILSESHAGSFYHYMLMQPASMHEKGAMICEYDGMHAMKVIRMRYNNHATPVVAFTEYAEFPEMMRGELPEEEEKKDYLPAAEPAEDERDTRFYSILKKIAPEQEISSVFLLGDGFQDQWMKKSVSYLTYHRRVFLGSNLYSKGAAYGAMVRMNPPVHASDYFFLGENRLKSNIGIMVDRNGHPTYQPLLSAGENWYEVQKEEEYILDSGNELQFVVTPLTGGSMTTIPVVLENPPARPERTTRLKVRITMTDPTTLSVHVEDLGFGEIFPSTEQVWDKKIEGI
ncbi:MAG: hypothetical protein II759_00165 [Lachnospiraceae bacterium]|nr:hypothetical protein [Lachnospiraceae bacterium]